MCLRLIQKNYGISGSIGVLAQNCIISCMVLIFMIIGITGELISIITGYFLTKYPKVERRAYYIGCMFCHSGITAIKIKGENHAGESYTANDFP